MRCIAQDLLARAGIDLTGLRDTALSYFLSGRMPRKLQLSREAALSRPIAARPMGSPADAVAHRQDGDARS